MSSVAADTHIWVAGEPVPPVLGAEWVADAAIVAALPVPGSELICAHTYAMSHFGNTYRIVAKLPDGSEAKYFLKIVADKRSGHAVLKGEYEAARAIHAILPSLVPKIHALGALPLSRSHFLLSEFRTVAKQPPAADLLVKQIAKLHQESCSPTGKFGFHVPTYWGNLEQTLDWEDSWTVAFSSILRNFLNLSNEVHGTTPEFEDARTLLFERVIPRLLDPLQSQGRILKPSLIHGDLWEGNCAEDERGQPFIFDCSSSYAHNEMEIAFWTPPRNLMAAGGFVEACKKLVPPSAPEEDWAARHKLYTLRWNASLSVIIPNSGQRSVLLEDMQSLCRDYAS